MRATTMPKFGARLWPPGTSTARSLGWAAVIGLVAMAMLAPASPALSNDTPGNNGTVKIHEDDTENDPGEVRNEPHVCTFHLHFYFSDPEQAGTWEIQEWSPGDKGTVVLSGTYDTQGDGEDRQPEQGVYTLPDGHYKLFWDGDLDTQKHDKMKVFWVDCETTTTTSSETTTTGSETTTTGSETTTTTSSSETTTTGSETSTTGSETSTTGTETSTTGTGTVSGTTTSSSTTETETSTTGTETSTTGTETSTTGTETSTTGTGTVSGTTTTASSTGTGSSSTTTSFSQTVSGTTNAGPTLPNTSAVENSDPTSGSGSAPLLVSVLAFLLGGLLVLAPARAKKRD